jgi:Ca-activated chloride channel family protein
MFSGQAGTPLPANAGSSSPGMLLHCRVSHPRMLVSAEQQRGYLLISVQASGGPPQGRLPLNLCLVLDTSASMKDDGKLNAVKAAVQALIGQMAPQDILSVVTFADHAAVVIPTQYVTNTAALQARIASLEARGGTQLGQGMEFGLAELRKGQALQTVTRMIVLTDGHTANTKTCQRHAREARKLGIPLYPFGVGAEWDEQFLDELGELSGGEPAVFLPRSTEVLDAFRQQVMRAMAVVAREALLRVDLAPGVEVLRVMRVAPQMAVLDEPGPGSQRAASHRVELALGEIEYGMPQMFLFELGLVLPQPGRVWLAHAELTYDLPQQQNAPGQLAADVMIEAVLDPRWAEAVDAQVMQIAERAAASRLVKTALDEYHQTGKVTIKLAPHILGMLDQETRTVLEQAAAGVPKATVGADKLKAAAQKTRRLI